MMWQSVQPSVGSSQQVVTEQVVKNDGLNGELETSWTHTAHVAAFFNFRIMAIEGILELFKVMMVVTHIREFAGLSLAVDVSSWIYRGLSGCLFEVAQNIDTDM